MEWIKFSKYNLPAQGLKIVCFNKGDLWIARRLNYKNKDYWVEIPYGGKSGFILTDVPLYWMPLDYPDGFTGYIKLKIGNQEPMTLDELQAIDEASHQEFVGMILFPSEENDGMD